MQLPPDFLNTPKHELTLPEGMTGFTLHCCCAPCAGAMLECFKVHKLSPTVFFYNPNIMPGPEYVRRRDELIALCKLLGFEYAVGDYDVRSFLKLVAGHESDPERSERCSLCFTHRLTVTAQFAKSLGHSHFTTTLATSRWKSKPQVDAAGFAAQEATGIKYWDEDWRKGGLVTRRYALVKEFGFYNQLYCGCVFSKIAALKKIPVDSEREG